MIYSSLLKEFNLNTEVNSFVCFAKEGFDREKIKKS